MRKFNLIFVTIVLILMPAIGICGELSPCTAIGYVNANTLIQAPSFSQDFTFSPAPVFTNCYGSTSLGPTTVTIIVSNPPQNPPPTAPVYMSLAGAGVPTGTSQVLLTGATTVISKSQFAGWFPTAAATAFTGVTVYSPGTAWVPVSITIIWQ